MNQPSHVPWPSIANFHTLRKSLRDASQDAPIAPISYRSKVKLHGTNVGVRVNPAKKSIVVQSRGRIITPTDDHMSFAKWAMARQEAIFAATHVLGDTTVLLFGEWCGPGVQQGVAAALVPEKFLAVFATLVAPDDKPITEGPLIVDPEQLENAWRDVPGFHILPWSSDRRVTIDWNLPSEALEEVAVPINDEVMAIEACDPWVKATFGVEGVGEGLVFYPEPNATAGSPEDPGNPGDPEDLPLPCLTMQHFGNFGFKAKGAEHRTVKSPKPVTPDAPTAETLEAFAELVLTPARLEQGLRIITEKGEAKVEHTGNFLRWIQNDVQKECVAELEASKLDWKSASKALTLYAKTWYVARL